MLNQTVDLAHKG